MIVTRAEPHHIPDILTLLNGAADRLHTAGINQWPGSPHFAAAMITPRVEAGDVYLAWNQQPVATIAITSAGDPAFWLPSELAEPASYLSSLARADGFQGCGAALWRWAVTAAAARDDRWVRLDARRDNPGLRSYWADHGWDYRRTVPAPGRHSGALFQRLALPQPNPFTEAPTLPSHPEVPRPSPGPIPAGTEVINRHWEHGVVTEVLDPGADREVVSAGWEYGTGHPALWYRVRLTDGRQMLASEADVTEAAAVKMSGPA